ncbi:bifunctional hydroxymethylpyrimidine kinase/phosphomethylpyrimidine kinase [Synechococcus sp. O70.2]|jgi:hydroxymethylpyrimidine/phosphomethylpyrimidine kinase|uniref:bifunctional hydroxymethylpyrimidine kinase/phosphomethylpyrimidine kinase n=1 Tax=Synechococcus sp. O70.2 TaxID=2964533 RepID=UPI0039C028EE
MSGSEPAPPAPTLAEQRPPVALTIAGSDSGGGAGIQADLRTFAFQRVHGTSALTCVTAQNTLGVNRVDALPPEAVAAQIEAVVQDIGVQGIKTGMLLNAEIVREVARQVERWALQPLVVDPVMVSRTGAKLLAEEAIQAIRERLIPLAQVVTPNRYEAQILAGMELQSLADMETAARRIHALGCKAVLVKGGGMPGELQGVDVWFDGERLEVLKSKRIPTRHTHGTGCTLSAAIAAQLAWGKDPLTATLLAKAYVTEALRHPLAIGAGQGPVGHFYPLLASSSSD